MLRRYQISTQVPRLFKFTRTPFGIRNPKKNFSRFNRPCYAWFGLSIRIFRRLVSSPDHQTNKKHLKILFKRLTEYGIITGPDKCQFGTTELSFLGHYVCPEGFSPLPTAVDAVVNFVKPEKQGALRRYLGMVNYYHHFIPHCVEKLTPLNNLLTEANEGQNGLSPKSNFELHWTDNVNVAFTESKQILYVISTPTTVGTFKHHV